MQITFRPHHFLCALCFKGRGYSPSFIANFQAITATLRTTDGDTTPIRIVDHTDSICAPCPHRTQLTCTEQAKIAKLDAAHAATLHIKAGDIITWQEAKKRIADHITLPIFHQICATCSWKAYGICEGVIKEFLTNDGN